MGRKKGHGEEEKEKAKEHADEGKGHEEDKPEDPPIIKELKAIDDKYLEIEREYEREMQQLQKKYTERQQPLLDQRAALLKDATQADPEAAKGGTPALKGFWAQAMKNLPALEDQIEEWDEPVLEFLSDIQKSVLDENDLHKGFKLSFLFVENPYFTNDVLWKEYYTEESSPYTGEIDTKEIKVSEIHWKAGKNVTVETIKKKTKGGGAKKAKQKGKEKEEPRDSFFRNFFRNLKPDMPIPDDVNLEEARQMCEDSDEEDEEEMMGLLMENDYEIGCSVRDQLVPFAVRWFTGEAQPDDGYDDDDEDDEEEDDDDDDDEEESEEEEEEEPAPKKKAQPKKRGGHEEKDKKKGGGGGGEGQGAAKAEECKQQ